MYMLFLRTAFIKLYLDAILILEMGGRTWMINKKCKKKATTGSFERTGRPNKRPGGVDISAGLISLPKHSYPHILQL